MDKETLNSIIAIVFIFVLGFGGFLAVFISDKSDKKHELIKLGILKPNQKKIKIETDYNTKLKYQLKFWLINIIAVIVICTICKLFGFGISDIVKLIK